MGENISAAMSNPEVGQNVLSARQIPTVAYALQNILISVATVIAALASLFFTVVVILPLSIMRTMSLGKKNSDPTGTIEKKVVLVLGASRGIGMNVVMQYIDEPNAVIIAASSSLDSLKEMAVRLGDTRATVHTAKLDLMESKSLVEKTIKDFDKQYGPISHFYAVSGISNHMDQNKWSADATMDMITVNITGTVAAVMAMYQLMRTRRYGKICIVGSLAGHTSVANMMSYASTKSFINTFSSSLRVLAAPMGVDVVSVQPGYIHTRLNQWLRDQGSSIPLGQFKSPREMARRMRDAMEEGGVGVLLWPGSQVVGVWAMRGFNPLCDELSKWITMRMGVAGKKIT